MQSWSQTDDLETLVSSLSFGSRFDGTDSEALNDSQSGDFLKQHFVGREEEAAVLRQTYHRISRKNAPSEVIVIHGISGCGKTCLVEQTLRDQVVLKGGYFVAGKADQVGRTDPYAEIMAALSDLIDLISQNDDKMERPRKFLPALQSELRVLLPLLPGLSLLLYNNPSTQNDMECSSQAFTRFKLALRTLLKALSSALHPIVVFFDDIQWMDQSSRSILECFIKDTSSQNILFICAYRDEAAANEGTEANNANEVSYMFDELRKHKTAPIRDLVLKNLSELDITKLLQVYLNTEEDEVALLARICFTRTLGNCFFLLQFLNVLKGNNLLTPPETIGSGWTWDTALIQSCSVATDNVLSILQSRMSKLSRYTRNVLGIASNLGFEFSRDSLELVVDSIQRDIQSGKNTLGFQLSLSQTSSLAGSLNEAIRKGLLEPLNNSNLKFAHDQVQTFFFNCIEETEHCEFLNLKIGRVLKEKMTKDPELVFQVADHLNRGLSLLQNRDDRIELAQINLVAAKASAEKSAFIIAAEYVSDGLLALAHESMNMWNGCYKLAVDLQTFGAKMFYVTGQFEASETMIDSVMANAENFDETFEVAMIKSDLLILQHKLNETVQMCVTLARELGEKIPRKPNGLHVLRQLMRTRRALRGLTTERILSLPLMRDKKLLQIAQTFFGISTPCFFGGDPLLGALTSLRFVEIAVKHGVSSIAATSFAFLSVMELHMGRTDKAYEYALLTHRLIDDPRLEAEKYRSRVYPGTYSMVFHWRRPMVELIAPLQGAYVDSFNAGDIVFGGLACNATVIYEFYSSVPLSIVENHLREANDLLKDYNQEYIRMFIMPFHQVVLNLLGESGGQPIHLNGESMVYSDYMACAHEMNHRYALSICRLWRLSLAFLFGSLTNAQAALSELVKSNAKKEFTGHCNLYFYKFYAAMTYYGLAQKDSSSKARYMIRCANKELRDLATFARNGCENVLPLIAILEAEKKIGHLQSHQLIVVFEEALKVVRTGPCKHFEGVCCEHLALALADLNDGRLRARAYLEAAREHYTVWEAEEKVNQVDTLLIKLAETTQTDLMNINIQISEYGTNEL